MNQTYLNYYFRNVWSTLPVSTASINSITGLELANQIKPNESVIDIGCGKNYFKKLIPNLVGIDPAFDEADYRVSLEEFVLTNKDKFNVAFCLGSINFGSKENIENQISLVKSLLLPNGRIYWRCNPGIHDHNTRESRYIDFYHWTFEEHVRLADMFNFEIIELKLSNSINTRIYSEWQLK